ncbi:MAG: hypothetical protein KKI02_05075, partial [Planctomycetes bacterium]|nr:hypothetical protein [Planctomycetota bacterium]
MTTRLLLCLTAVLGALVAQAGAEPYWIAYEGNDFPENEGWTREINAAGGANRWIEDGALVIDSLHNAAIIDDYFIEGISDPGPGELFVAEWRVLQEETLFWYDAGVVIARSAVPGHVFFVYDVDEILVWREWEQIPITPGEWHACRIETEDMVEYTLWIDDGEVFTGLFEDQSLLESFVVWGDMFNGAASLTRWDYVRFGVVPEPSAVCLVIAGLAACVLRSVRSGTRRVVLIPVLACILSASVNAEPYWITYEGNDLPENEGWERHWGNDEGAHEGDGALRTVEDGILTMDSLYDLRVYDYACRYLYGEFDPDPGELFVAEWRGMVDEVLGDHYDAAVGICSDDAWQLGFGFFSDHVESIWEDDVHIPVTAGVFHEYRLLSWDMQTYDLYIDGDLAYQGTFWQGLVTSKLGWGDFVRGAASRSHWDYVRFGVVPEPSALWLFVAALTACAMRTVPRRARRVVLLPVLACILAASATAEPYWIAYEGNDFPENEGWLRGYSGGGAERWIEDGMLVLDGLADLGI